MGFDNFPLRMRVNWRRIKGHWMVGRQTYIYTERETMKENEGLIQLSNKNI